MKKKVFALIIIMVLGLSSIAFGSSGFKDIKPNDWYYEYVMKISNMGIINGFKDNTFKPNNNVTRAELAKILVEYDKINKGTTYDEQSTINAIAIAINSTVRIDGDAGYGSGFFVKNNIIMTNAHVVGSDDKISIITYNGDKIVGSVISRDKAKDIALIKVDKNFKPLKFSSNLKLGQNSIAIGTPLGMNGSASKGIVSKIGISEFKASYMFQMDTPINNGDSGGPVINSNGEVIGMTTGKLTEIDTFVEGISFAIQAKELESYLNSSVK